MKNQLTAYVDLLFAGRPDAEEMKQEILQNTLDRYDDLVDQGKTPEAAYTLAISGIGDIGEILSRRETQSPLPAVNHKEADEKQESRRKLMRSIAVGLYILCPVPLFIIQNEIGLCLLLLIVAAATVLIILGNSGKEEKEAEEGEFAGLSPQQRKLRKSIRSIINAGALAIYLVVSFTTHAWHITWLIFPIAGALMGLIHAILDLKGEK